MDNKDDIHAARYALTTGQAALLVPCHRATLAKRARAGDLPPGICRKIFGEYRFDERALRAWAESLDVSTTLRAEPARRGRPTVISSVIVGSNK